MKRILLFIVSAILSATALAQLTQPPGGITGNMPPWSGGNGTSGQILTSRGATLAPTFQADSGGATGANPTASLTTTAINGVATTFMRSDAAPALDQTMSPATLSGSWTWSAASNVTINSSNTVTVGTALVNGGRFGVTSTTRPTNGLAAGAGNTTVISANGSQSALFNSNGRVDLGAVLSTGTKFTAAGTGCTVGTTTGGASAGTFTLAAGPCTSVAVTLNGATGMAAVTGWTCQAHDRTAPTVLIGGEASSTTTTATFTIPAGAGATDVISFSCTGF